jgi:hypothetical protein
MPAASSQKLGLCDTWCLSSEIVPWQTFLGLCDTWYCLSEIVLAGNLLVALFSLFSGVREPGIRTKACVVNRYPPRRSQAETAVPFLTELVPFELEMNYTKCQEGKQ